MTNMTVAKLIEALKKKEQSQEVEFIVCRTDGAIVCMNVERNAKDIVKLLKLMS